MFKASLCLAAWLRSIHSKAKSKMKTQSSVQYLNRLLSKQQPEASGYWKEIGLYVNQVAHFMPFIKVKATSRLLEGDWLVREPGSSFHAICKQLKQQAGYWKGIGWYVNQVAHFTLIAAQWEGMGDVGSARYEPALLPPCPTIRVLSYSNCQEVHPLYF